MGLMILLKRSFDLVLSLIGLIILSPIMLGIALWIKLDSKGPVFYRGRRVGRFGRPFRIYKFRTMVVNAESIGGSSTSENDPRITRAGNILRRYKLDELPQLINVLIGDMSFVGPRPEVEEYTRLYNEKEQQILSVPPGITDYSSIKFRNLGLMLADSNDPDKYYRDVIRPIKNRLRLEYARNHSLWEDLKIILLTLKAVFIEKPKDKGGLTPGV